MARQGAGWLTARLHGGVTRLTRVAHRAPARLLPMMTAGCKKTGAAACAIGSYGGGLLGGDVVSFDVLAAPGATLSLGTQASTKIYRTKLDGHEAEQRLRARVQENALLVVVPDPLIPYAHSAYEGIQQYAVEPGGSLVAVDWFGSGRAACGERWEFLSFGSRTEVCLEDPTSQGLQSSFQSGGDFLPSTRPVLIEAVRMGNMGNQTTRSCAFDIGGVQRDAVATVVLTGPRVAEVVSRFHVAAAAIAARRSDRHTTCSHVTSLSRAHEAALEAAPWLQSDGQWLGLLGDVVLGVSDHQCSRTCTNRSEQDGAPAHAQERVTVARIIAEHNEDVYRLLRYCLQPLGSVLGAIPYADRIHATASACPPIFDARAREASASKLPHDLATARKWRPKLVAPNYCIRTHGYEDVKTKKLEEHCVSMTDVPSDLNASRLLTLVQLCDATLPTGGFAHSSGLEAAEQFALLGSSSRIAGRQGTLSAPSSESLHDFVQASVQSSTQLFTPFAIAAHSAFISNQDEPTDAGSAIQATLAKLIELNVVLDAQLATTAPARRASLQQGAALARVAHHWLTRGPMGETRAETRSKQHSSPNIRRTQLVSELHLDGHAHGAIVLGALAAALDLSSFAVRIALVHTSTRDVISAAVRLNLIGPLAAVHLQSQVTNAAATASTGATTQPAHRAAGSAPLLDAIHSCHDMLERRIFQT